ncbi:MAG TPA: hypothetical protein VN519_06860 [Bryobacteraceae bacterium]|nr:hypothetical protein [Bryobacteraceae bacterium]
MDSLTVSYLLTGASGVVTVAMFLVRPSRKNRPTPETSPLDMVVPDPVIGILQTFEAIPASELPEMFRDFEEAAEAQDLRRLQDVISDWSATGEMHASEWRKAVVP